jgi:hypothetical protein
MSEQSGPSRRNDMIIGALILLAGIIVGRVLGTDFSSLLNIGNGRGENTANSNSSGTSEVARENADQVGRSDISDNESSFSDNRSDSGVKLVESAPMEYLQSLAAARRICFLMERGADAATAIQMNFTLMGIAASHDMYEKGVPKPTAFSMDGVRVINTIQGIKSTHESQDDRVREMNRFAAASFNKAYQTCPDSFTDSEVQQLQEVYSKVSFE